MYTSVSGTRRREWRMSSSGAGKPASTTLRRISRGRLPAPAETRRADALVSLAGPWRTSSSTSASGAPRVPGRMHRPETLSTPTSPRATTSSSRSADGSGLTTAAATHERERHLDHPSRSATAMCSSGVWISIIPFARFTHCRPRALKTFASAPPPLSAYDGGVAGALERLAPRAAPAGRPRGTGSRGSSAGPRTRPRSRRGSPRTPRSRASPARARPPCVSSCERTSAVNEHHSGTTFRAVPPEMTPTFALVSSSTRPRRKSAIARDAAAIAERPSSGCIPACAAAPWKRKSRSRACGEPSTISPIARALVVDVARRRDEPRVVERVGARGATPPPAA